MGSILGCCHHTGAFGLYLQSGGLVHGATYIERAANVVGVRADVRFRAISGTMMSLGVYGTRGTSTAQYTGIAGPETMTRSLDVAGVDAGWQPGVFESPMLSVRVPVGPSLAWQKLHLSEGHRDAYATPGGGPVEDVDWSDRTWTSIGGHIGMAVSMHTSSHFDVFLTGRGRFLFNRGSGAWGDRERADIQRSTGNTVTITYTDRVVLQSGLEAGVEWRP